MPYARVARFTMSPGSLDALLHHARTELVPRIRQQPGFRGDTLYRLGPDACLCVTLWDREEDARRVGETFAGWVQQEMGPSLVAIERHGGSVTITYGDPAASGHAAGISFWELKPGRLAALTPRLRDEYAPIVAQRQGFVRYAVVETGADRAIVFVVYGSTADADLPPTQASDVWVASAGFADAVVSVHRLAGEVVWHMHAERAM
jgi:hypothetical protein